MTGRLFAQQGAEVFVGLPVFEKVGAQDDVVVDGFDLALVLFLVVFDPFDIRDVEPALFDPVFLYYGIGHRIAVDGDRGPLGGQYAGFADFQQREDQQGEASGHEDHGLSLIHICYDSWLFHKGSSEIRIFVYDGDYLFSTSPINLLPKKEVEPVLDYMLSEDFGPYKLGIEGRQIYIAYRIHLSDITAESEETIRQNIVNLAFRADEMDNMMVERFGCEFSEYSKSEA